MFSKIALGVTALLSVAVVTVNGACDNGCSGHGTCGADDVCKCYPNWRMGDEDSGDCSDRVCPFEVAWVDKPNKDGSFHNYAECAGRGLCNRGTGECECFEGYSGKACQRTTCPNDCSGHGTCEYIEEMGFYSVHGDYFEGQTVGSSGVAGSQSFGNRAVTFTNQDWDNHKTMGCVCDPKWTDVDCSRRMCPKGNDVLNTRINVGDTVLYQEQQIFIPYLSQVYAANSADVIGHTLFEGAAAGASDDASFGVAGSHFALTFVSTLNETFTTKPIEVKASVVGAFSSAALQDVDTTATATNIKNALINLPHKVIDDCIVTIAEARTAGANMGLTITVTFTGDAVQGPQNLLQVEDLACDKGCYPFLPKGTAQAWTLTNGVASKGGMVPQTATWSTNNALLPFVKQSVAADYNNYECGRRGKCNYGSGLCECFDGYSGENCNTQTALL